MKLSEFWVQDCSAATENVLLRATDMGLGAVWCGLYPQKNPVENVRKMLELSDKQVPLNVIFVGWPAEEQEAKDWFEEKSVHYVK